MADHPTALRRLTAVALGAAVLLLGSPGAAAAHDSLAASTPASGTTVAAPTAVTLEFEESPEALGTQVAVTGPDGTSVTRGDPALGGTTVTQPLADDLPAGTYAVDWRVASDDGHPVTGTFSFTVADGGSTPAPASSGAGPSTPGSAALLWVGLGAIVAVAGLLLVRQLRRPA